MSDFFDILLRGGAQIFFEGGDKIGVASESRFQGDRGYGYPFAQEGDGVGQAAGFDIVADAESRLCLEHPAEIIFIEIEFFAEHIQRNGIIAVVPDIVHDLVYAAVFSRGGG